ncbi:unnamed protein product, partial [Ectocarpus sp. 6 AP-2014]
MKTLPGPASFSFVCFSAKTSLNVLAFSVFRDAGGQLALQPLQGLVFVCVCLFVSCFLLCTILRAVYERVRFLW